MKLPIWAPFLQLHCVYAICLSFKFLYKHSSPQSTYSNLIHCNIYHLTNGQRQTPKPQTPSVSSLMPLLSAKTNWTHIPPAPKNMTQMRKMTLKPQFLTFSKNAMVPLQSRAWLISIWKSFRWSGTTLAILYWTTTILAKQESLLILERMFCSWHSRFSSMAENGFLGKAIRNERANIWAHNNAICSHVIWVCLRSSRDQEAWNLCDDSHDGGEDGLWVVLVCPLCEGCYIQQGNRNMQEVKRYFSRKHKLYGYKIEASILPNGLCTGLTPHYPGSTSDLEFFQKSVALIRRIWKFCLQIAK